MLSDHVTVFCIFIMSNKIIESSLLMRTHFILKKNRDEISGGKLQIMLQSSLFTPKDIQLSVYY